MTDIIPLKFVDRVRCDKCEHSAMIQVLACTNQECDNIEHRIVRPGCIVRTDYGEYDSDDIESMLSYCMSLRGTFALPSIMIELGCFTEAVHYGSFMIHDEKAKEICEEYGHDIEWYNPIISLIRLFVRYCEKEYGENSE